jgi:peptide methionine sulfoxide reductase MsrA
MTYIYIYICELIFLQYTSLIFCHDQEQKELAEKTLKEEEKKTSTYIVTKILPAKEFYDAEE